MFIFFVNKKIYKIHTTSSMTVFGGGACMMVTWGSRGGGGGLVDGFDQNQN